MTTATLTDPNAVSSVLDEAAQALIDTRLDTIDRMLMGQVPRADRLAIVREVEAQLHDLLAERNPDETDRDAVLAALARLDPPEAYLPDEGGSSPRSVAPPSRGPARSTGARAGVPLAPSPLGKVSGILGVTSIVLLIPTVVSLCIAFNSGSNFPVFSYMGFDLVVIFTSLLAVIFAACARLRSTFAVVGLTTGIIAILPGLAGAVFILMELLV